VLPSNTSGMWESAAELHAMQEVLDTSAERAGEHLRCIFDPPRHSLSAAQVATLFRGKKQIAVATVTARSEPRVAPVDALLIHGRFCFGTHVSSARVRHLRKRPAVTLTYFEQDDLAIIVHGCAQLVEHGQPGFTDLDQAFVTTYGGTLSTAEEGSVYICVDAETMFTFARHPDRFQSD
jgi:hypothetical protein